MSSRRILGTVQMSKIPLKSRELSQHKWLFSRSDLHAMAENWATYVEMGGASGISFALRTHLTEGLYKDEVDGDQYQYRQRQYGINVVPTTPLKSFWRHCWEALDDTLLQVLMVAGLVSFFLGLYEDPQQGWYEGAAIWFAVFLVTVVGGGTNYTQERKFAELNSKQKKDQVRVIRKGNEMGIAPEEILVGDLVCIKSGELIPADGVIVQAVGGATVMVDESSLTGENAAVAKDFYRPFLISGTTLKTGSCNMLITAVGQDTKMGVMMDNLGTKKEPSKLTEKLDTLAEQIGYLGTGVAVTMFVGLTVFWAIEVLSHNLRFSEHGSEILEYFIIAVTIVVVAIPEGLPLAVNISLAFSMKKMFNDKILVKILTACETMGNCTTICSDKTGTLTQNVMTVEECLIGTTPYAATPAAHCNEQLLDMKTMLSPEVFHVLKDSIVRNSAVEFHPDSKNNRGDRSDHTPSLMDLNPDKPEKWEWQNGNPTEVALNAWFVRNKVSHDEFQQREPHIAGEPFNSIVKYSAILVHAPKGAPTKYRRYFKGASDVIVNMCSNVIDEKGGVGAQIDQKTITGYVDDKAAGGYRTIAFAYHDMETIDRDPETQKIIYPSNIQDATLIGVAAIRDPLRPSTRNSVRTCQRAGIVVIMVTGDHLKTAQRIAQDCGIYTDPEHISMTGDRFNALYENDPAKLATIMPKIRVIARSQPFHKMNLVKFLKSQNKQVAVTGDGTNDAMAMKAAHIGIAMNSGTDFCKNAAHTVIVDDRFSSIVRSVMWGRSVYDNIAKFVQFQLTVNLVALAISLIGAFTGWTSPLKAVQLLWVNLIMDTMAALALGTEAPSSLLLRRTPFSPDAHIISPVMARNILAQTVLQIVVLCILMFSPSIIFDDVEDKSMRHYTIIFNTFVFMQFFNEINSRKVNKELNVFSGFFSNFYFVGVLIVTAVLQFLMVEYFGNFADTVPLVTDDWIRCVVIGVLALPVGFFIRIIFNGRFGIIDFTSGKIKVDEQVEFKGADLHSAGWEQEESFLKVDDGKQGGQSSGSGENEALLGTRDV